MTESHFARLDVHFRTDALSSNASQRRAVSATCGDASGVGRLAAEVEGGDSDDPTRASRQTGACARPRHICPCNTTDRGPAVPTVRQGPYVPGRSLLC